MSILAALVRAYERMEGAPPFGFVTQDTHFFITLDTSGQVVGKPSPWGTDEKGRLIARPVNVPYFGGRSGSAAPPYFLWDNSAYVLGVTAKDGFDAEKRFDSFRKLHLENLSAASDAGLVALREFLRNWSPDNFDVLGYPSEIKDRNIVFRLQSEQLFVHESAEAKRIWGEFYVPDTIGEAVCLISGKRERIARLHPPIKSFENPARIVSFDKDNDAFSSYGHVQAENAPTGIASAFAYTAALNAFLAKGSGHRLQLGDASTVFWADCADMKTAAESESLFAAMFDAPPTAEDDAHASAQVGARLEAIRQGRPLAEVAPKLDEGVRFFVLGLAPNAARLSIRFYLADDFGRIAANYQRFLADMALEPPPRGSPPLWRYLVDLAVQGKRENVPPNLAGDWMRAILSGTPYPLTLLSTALMRIRADGEIGALRVGILKAVLIRNYKQEAPVALDPDNRNKGYLLGRLFAVYEEIQRAALGKVNASIRDKFYGAASAAPQKVFGLLDRGSASHLGKVRKEKPGYEYILRRDIAAIMEMMDPGDTPYPASLSAEQQALFALGYYHQSFTPRQKADEAPTSAETGESE